MLTANNYFLCIAFKQTMSSLTITAIDQYITTQQKDLLVISGPCSAETPVQLFTTAEELKATQKVDVLRAGIWKPRTRPNSFEGVGSEALNWLVEAGKQLNLPTAVEVANQNHVEQALKAGVSILWIGARTTVNPFSVQEIANALKGVDVPVFVKNPINPDLALWIGALERLNQVGITKLAAIHRGFSYYGKLSYRNNPMWEIPIQLKTQFPNLPIICDPSHIAGTTTLLQEVAQKALDLNMNGLMLESHCTPHLALSDKDQQITPNKLLTLLNELIIRNEHTSDPVFINRLSNLRALIDDVDKDLLNLLLERQKLVEQIGTYKKENNITVLQLERWKEIIDSRTEFGNNLGLSEAYVVKLLESIHKESIRIQTELLNKEKAE